MLHTVDTLNNSMSMKCR